MIGRRGFLKAIGVSVLGLSIALRQPERQLSFTPETPSNTGIMSVRFIRNQSVDRVDVTYGWSVVRPEFAVRVTDAPWWERFVFWRAA